MDATQNAFHLEEYKQLRAEVMTLLTRIEQLFRYSMIIAASIYAWLLVNSLGLDGAVTKSCLKLPLTLMIFGWVIPPLFIAGAGRMAYITNIRVAQMGKYLRTLEDALGVSSLGWEKAGTELAAILVPATRNAWWTIFVVALLMSIVGCFIGATTSVACPIK